MKDRPYTKERLAAFGIYARMCPDTAFWCKPDHLSDELVSNILQNDALIQRLENSNKGAET